MEILWHRVSGTVTRPSERIPEIRKFLIKIRALDTLALAGPQAMYRAHIAHRRATSAATINGEQIRDRDALAAPLTRGHPRRGHPRQLAAARSHRCRRHERPCGGRCRGGAVGASQFRPALCMLYPIHLARTPSPNWVLTRELR